MRHHVRLESMVPYHPRAVGCAQWARMLDLTQMDTPLSSKRDIGGIRLCDVSAGHINALHAELQGDGLSVATRRLVHALLRRALNDAVRWGKLTRNPVTAADPPAAEDTRVQSWRTPSELRRFRVRR